MANNRKYTLECSGSGWGIWEIATGKKVENYGRHFCAVEALYRLNGWYFNPDKYYRHRV